MRTQADLVDQLSISSEKRLARILLLIAEFGKPGKEETLIPLITQETLANMIGTTRSRVSFFMNRFRKLGLLNTTVAFTFTSLSSTSFSTTNHPQKTPSGHHSWTAIGMRQNLPIMLQLTRLRRVVFPKPAKSVMTA